MIKNNSNCYRIVTDKYSGYEVQLRRRFLFWSTWEQVGINTHRTIDEAKEFIKSLPKEKDASKQKIVWMCDNCK